MCQMEFRFYILLVLEHFMRLIWCISPGSIKAKWNYPVSASPGHPRGADSEILAALCEGSPAILQWWQGAFKWEITRLPKRCRHWHGRKHSAKFKIPPAGSSAQSTLEFFPRLVFSYINADFCDAKIISRRLTSCTRLPYIHPNGSFQMVANVSKCLHRDWLEKAQFPMIYTERFSYQIPSNTMMPKFTIAKRSSMVE